MNQTTIDQILADCYAIDPSLKQHEPELREVVQKLLAAKPDARPDAAFVARLRKAVTAQASGNAPSASFADSFRNLFSLRMPLPVGAALALVAVIAVASAMPSKRATSPDTVNEVVRSAGGKLAVADLDSGAFGSLAQVNSGAAMPVARPQSGGGGGLGAGSMATSAIAPNTAIGSDAKMMMPYEYVNYRYTYEGELPTIESEMSVFRRVKGFGGSLGSASSLYSAVASLIDLNRLENASLLSYSVSEDKQFGLTASVAADEGVINLSQNWRLWPHPENQCRDEECWARFRLTADQVPQDDAVIGIADKFLADYGIDLGMYGKPEVRSEWRMMYASALVKSDVYIPDTVSVVYPQVVDGKTVVDESGAANGLAVSVNVRHMRVDGAWNITGRNFERSGYAMETDTTRIMKYVAQGGIWGNYVDPAAKTVDIILGTPELVYLKTYRTATDGFSSDELYVPAWRFPVTNPPSDQPWFRTSVVVPIAKESLDVADQNNVGNPGIPTPMPLMRDGGASNGVMTAPAATTVEAPAPDPAR